MKKFGSVLLRLIACLVVFDLIGVAGAFVFDIFFSGPALGALLFYATWFVDGVFCGAVAYSVACGEDVADQAADEKVGLVVIGTSLALTGGLLYLFYVTMWQRGVADEHYVPDNVGLTITFFVAMIGMMVLSHTALRPNPKKSESAKLP